MEAVQLKPTTQILSLRDSEKRTLSLEKSHYLISTLNHFYTIPIHDIIYIQAAGNYSTVYLKDGRNILTSKTLKYHADRLPKTSFLRTHQSYLINRQYINSVLRKNNLIQLKEGTQIPISRSNKSIIKELFKNQ